MPTKRKPRAAVGAAALTKAIKAAVNAAEKPDGDVAKGSVSCFARLQRMAGGFRSATAAQGVAPTLHRQHGRELRSLVDNIASAVSSSAPDGGAALQAAMSALAAVHAFICPPDNAAAAAISAAATKASCEAFAVNASVMADVGICTSLGQV